MTDADDALGRMDGLAAERNRAGRGYDDLGKPTQVVWLDDLYTLLAEVKRLRGHAADQDQRLIKAQNETGNYKRRAEAVASALSAKTAELEKLRAVIGPAVGLVEKAELTRLVTDHVPADPEGTFREGWRIHDMPDEPNPHGVWIAEFMADGLDEDYAKAFTASVNAIREAGKLMGGG